MLSALAKKALLAAIDAYRFALSPLLGGNCRFTPSCSQYAREAVELHGPAKGSLLAARRVLRCHPFHPGGYDPVEPAEK
ncbi:MAG: membrane protein insertion efficiency factor YidD [Thermodesulfovibrionales bacterium]